MKESEIQQHISQKIQLYEQLAFVEPSDDWEQKLHSKMTLVSHNRHFKSQLYIGVVLLLLVNISIIANTIWVQVKQSSAKKIEYKLIESELLSNTFSSNN
jgi:hypothetical protein